MIQPMKKTKIQMMMNREKHMQTLLLLAAFFGATGVAIGAFGAHGLSAILEANGRAGTFQHNVSF